MLFAWPGHSDLLFTRRRAESLMILLMKTGPVKEAGRALVRACMHAWNSHAHIHVLLYRARDASIISLHQAWLSLHARLQASTEVSFGTSLQRSANMCCYRAQLGVSTVEA